MNEENISQVLDAFKLFEVWRIVLLLVGIGVLVLTAGMLTRIATRAPHTFPRTNYYFYRSSQALISAFTYSAAPF